MDIRDKTICTLLNIVIEDNMLSDESFDDLYDLMDTLQTKHVQNTFLQVILVVTFCVGCMLVMTIGILIAKFVKIMMVSQNH